QCFVEADRNVPPQDFESGLSPGAQRPRPFQRAFHGNLEKITRAALELHGDVELSQEMKRIELDQDIEPDVALDAEAVRSRVEIRPRAELHRIRGNGEI